MSLFIVFTFGMVKSAIPDTSWASTNKLKGPTDNACTQCVSGCLTKIVSQFTSNCVKLSAASPINRCGRGMAGPSRGRFMFCVSLLSDSAFRVGCISHNMAVRLSPWLKEEGSKRSQEKTQNRRANTGQKLLFAMNSNQGICSRVCKTSISSNCCIFADSINHLISVVLPFIFLDAVRLPWRCGSRQ